MTSFNLYSYATIARAAITIYDRGKVVRNVNVVRPNFESPRPCFGFIWGNMNDDVRCNGNFTVDYHSDIYINRNSLWATTQNRKNYCALTDEEIELYLDFVSRIAGEKFNISAKDFEDNKDQSSFKGIIVTVDAKNVPFKHVMVICNMIRYMYEWPEAYNVKQMMIAFHNNLFYEDFGQIFCLYESFMMNNYDQKISQCYNEEPSFIFPKTTEQLAECLQVMDISKEAAAYLQFSHFKPMMNHVATKTANNHLWVKNKYNEYKSDLYIKDGDNTLDEKLTKEISSLYRLIIMNDNI